MLLAVARGGTAKHLVFVTLWLVSLRALNSSSKQICAAYRRSMLVDPLRVNDQRSGSTAVNPREAAGDARF